jgi:actin
MVGLDNNDIYMGSDAESKKGVLKVSRPVEGGQITDWDDMEKLWHYTLQVELRVSPEHHPILLTESPQTPREQREKMTQIMFEVFNVPCLYVQNTAVLALYSGGRTTGVVLDSGFGISHSVPIYEGYAIPSGIERINISGEHLTQEMQKLLNTRGASQSMIGSSAASSAKKTFTTPAEVVQLQIMKETMTYVVENYD